MNYALEILPYVYFRYGDTLVHILHMHMDFDTYEVEFISVHHNTVSVEKQMRKHELVALLESNKAIVLNSRIRG